MQSDSPAQAGSNRSRLPGTVFSQIFNSSTDGDCGSFFSGQLVSVFDYPHSKEVFSCVEVEITCMKFYSLLSCQWLRLRRVQHSLQVLCQVFICVGKAHPEPPLLQAEQSQVFSAFLHMKMLEYVLCLSCAGYWFPWYPRYGLTRAEQRSVTSLNALESSK